MGNFWRVVNDVIFKADVLLVLLDARLVHETMNKEVEDKVRKAGKPLIFVITKCDLVQKEEAEKYKKILKPCVFISAVKFQGTTKLRERILIEGKKLGLDKVKVGVLGYPNVGKSSLINAVKGKASASTSSASGHTKGIQKVKADNRIMFLDSPGVIPYKEKDPLKHAFIGTIDFNRVKDPDLVVFKLMESFPGKVQQHFEVEENEDYEEALEQIAIKRNILKKGNEADILRTARLVIKEWQEGKIK